MNIIEGGFAFLLNTGEMDLKKRRKLLMNSEGMITRRCLMTGKRIVNTKKWGEKFVRYMNALRKTRALQKPVQNEDVAH